MSRFTRRRLISILGSSVAGVSAVGRSSAADIDGSVTFDDQTTDGTEVTVAEVRASADVTYILSTPDHEIEYATGTLPAGRHEDVTLSLETILKQERTLHLTLYPAEGGSSITKDAAEVSVADDVTYLDEQPVTRVDADPNFGFNYPYFLYAPETVQSGAEPAILVQPNNTGTATDDFAEHVRAARGDIERGFPRSLSGSLGVPLLVPVFPRPRSTPVDGFHYVHQLDRDTMQIDGGPLERVDRQLLRMVDHAQKRLAEADYPVRDEIMLNGFSASGNFVDRFAVLHPERVLSVTAGGLNGMALLPVAEADGHRLPYHVGIADVESITGDPVDRDALDGVNQLLYMGSEDTNDTIPYDDAWTSDQLRQTALDVYGEDMIRERFPTCQRVYEEADVDAQFRIYEGVGHTPLPAERDIVAFHRRSLAGQSVSDFGESIRPTATFAVTPDAPAVDEQVEFDASRSQTVGGTILSYTWDFDDGATAAGETVTHTFSEPGEYTVSFSFVDDSGLQKTATTTVTVTTQGDAPASEPTATPAETATATATQTAGQTATPGESGPGFGVGSALGGIAGAGTAIRWLRDDEE